MILDAVNSRMSVEFCNFMVGIRSGCADGSKVGLRRSGGGLLFKE